MEIEHQYKQQMIATHRLSFRTVPIFKDKANPKMLHSGLEDPRMDNWMLVREEYQNLNPVTLRKQEDLQVVKITNVEKMQLLCSTVRNYE